jgi:Tol biopolymer transport system component
MTLSPGTRLGPYEIVAPLGAGGMGEVYRARDPRLNRDVAIKVLPAAFAADADRMRRFTQEARAAGSLQHPNIVTVFDVGGAPGEAGSGDVAYVVQELVPGGTLRDRMTRGSLPLREALRITSAIAAGLAAAHEKGIVHRDLKPENVAIADEGRPQVLDFGLARVTTPVTESATGSAMETSAGLVIGTVGYMAPEQVRGEAADARSDLFALGTMLHEMLSGSRPFSRGSAVETLHAILTEEPPPLPASVPAPVARVVSRCLEKDPRLRFQSARDLSFTLDLVSGEGVRTGEEAPGAGVAARARKTPAWAVATVAAVAGAIATILVTGLLWERPQAEGSIRVSTLSQGNRDSEPSVSPDGRLVAFTAVRQNGQGIWLMDLVTRNEVKLTNGADITPRFTADGGSVTFTRTVAGVQSLWRVPVIGGSPRLVLENAADGASSPDGTQIAYMSGTTDSSGVRAQLMVARTDGTGSRELWSEASVALGTPAWSPDGKRIALFRGGNQNTASAVVIVDVASGKARYHPSPHGAILSNPCWDGTGTGILVAEGEGVVAVQRGASGHLYRLDTQTGKYRALGWLGDYPAVLDLLPDGRLVTSSFLARQNLREVAINARSLVDARTLTSGMAIDRQPVYSPDGRWIMFSSSRGGTLDLWEVSVESGEMHRLTDDPADDWDPAYSRDGQSVFWSSNRSGAFEIWAARRDGSSPRQVSHDSLDAENPSPSPDARWALYSSASPAKSGLWRVPLDGGQEERVLRNGTLIPDLSPDGRYVSLILDVGTLASKLSVLDLETRRTLPAPVVLRVSPGTVQTGRSRWLPDGNSIAYVFVRDDGRALLLRRPLSAWRTGAGEIDTLFAGSAETIESFHFSPDGKRAVVSVVDWLSGLTITDAVPGVVPPKRRT